MDAYLEELERLISADPEDDEAATRAFLEMRRQGWEPELVETRLTNTSGEPVESVVSIPAVKYDCGDSVGQEINRFKPIWIPPVEEILSGYEPPRLWKTKGLALVVGSGGILERGWLVDDGVPKRPFSGVIFVSKITGYWGDFRSSNLPRDPHPEGIELEEKRAYVWCEQANDWLTFDPPSVDGETPENHHPLENHHPPLSPPNPWAGGTSPYPGSGMDIPYRESPRT